MKVVVGLGNPGSRYALTRHNAGYLVIDLLAKSAAPEKYHQRFAARIAELRLDQEKVLLVKPETFMNLSGKSVRQLADFYELALPDLLIVCDDVNLPLGKLRMRIRGSHGGHNGLRDIQSHLGTDEYTRLRIGVGAADGGELVDHVLGRFRPTEQAIIADATEQAAQAVVVWAREGAGVCMNQYNG
jgi:PTH1 family peptidyl-tRNA hydrolase